MERKDSGHEDQSKGKKDSAVTSGAEDPELEALLDSSLGEFGKHRPPVPTQQAPATSPGASFDPNLLGGSIGARAPSSEDHLENVFGEEMAAQAEAQLNEAIQMLATENPDLMKQFESFAQSFGLEDMPLETPDPGPSSSVDPPTQSQQGGGATRSSLDEALEDTVRNLQQSTQHLQTDGLPPQFMEMLSKLQVQGDKADTGEEGLLKMMEGMMSTLLSREVLYPSLQDLVNQYPDWLRQHDSSLSPEDKQRYHKQLDLMRRICVEFESEEVEGGRKKSSSHQKQRQQNVLALMQELQECGQPPEDLAGSSLGQPGFPTPSSDPNKCPVM